MTENSQSSTKFEYTTANIINETKGFNIDVRSVIVELELFENISNTGITGKILIVDNQNLFNEIKFTGTESLELTIESSSNNSSPITKTFIMSRISGVSIANETTTAYVFTLIERHVFLSMLQKISKAYTGTPKQIINNILTGFLDVKIKEDVLNESGPVQTAMSLITPYINPIVACQWVRNRSTTEKGMPYFLYGSLRSDDISFESLEALLDKDTFPEPFTYSMAGAASDDPKTIMFNIIKLQSKETSDTVAAMMNGAIGSNYTVLDTTTGRTNPNKQFKISDVLESNMYDTEFVIKDKKIDEYESSIIFDIVAPAQETTNSYNYDPDLTSLKSKIANRSFYKALTKNEMEITVSGEVFLLREDIGVGSRIDIRTIASDGQGNLKDDINKSGKYMIMTTKHLFLDNDHTVLMRVTKL